MPCRAYHDPAGQFAARASRSHTMTRDQNRFAVLVTLTSDSLDADQEDALVASGNESSTNDNPVNSTRGSATIATVSCTIQSELDSSQTAISAGNRVGHLLLDPSIKWDEASNAASGVASDKDLDPEVPDYHLPTDFFDLPAEIRNYIYELVFARQVPSYKSEDPNSTDTITPNMRNIMDLPASLSYNERQERIHELFVRYKNPINEVDLLTTQHPSSTLLYVHLLIFFEAKEYFKDYWSCTAFKIELKEPVTADTEMLKVDSEHGNGPPANILASLSLLSGANLELITKLNITMPFSKRLRCDRADDDWLEGTVSWYPDAGCWEIKAQDRLYDRSYIMVIGWGSNVKINGAIEMLIPWPGLSMRSRVDLIRRANFMHPGKVPMKRQIEWLLKNL